MDWRLTLKHTRRCGGRMPQCAEGRARPVVWPRGAGMFSYAPVEARNYRVLFLFILFLKISSMLKSGKIDLIRAIVDKLGFAFLVDSSL